MPLLPRVGEHALTMVSSYVRRFTMVQITAYPELSPFSPTRPASDRLHELHDGRVRYEILLSHSLH